MRDRALHGYALNVKRNAKVSRKLNEAHLHAMWNWMKRLYLWGFFLPQYDDSLLFELS
jgi:hypothetical protein